MIQSEDRKWLHRFFQLGLTETVTYCHNYEIRPKPGWRWLIGSWYKQMLKRQDRDDRHHAPACPANHYHYRRPVLRRCNCGAASAGGETDDS